MSKIKICLCAILLGFWQLSHAQTASNIIDSHLSSWLLLFITIAIGVAFIAFCLVQYIKIKQVISNEEKRAKQDDETKQSEYFKNLTSKEIDIYFKTKNKQA